MKRVTFKVVKRSSAWDLGPASKEVSCNYGGENFAYLVQRIDKWRIKIVVPKEPTFKWQIKSKWALIKNEFDTLEAAKAFVKKRRDDIFSMLSPHVRRQLGLE